MPSDARFFSEDQSVVPTGSLASLNVGAISVWSLCSCALGLSPDHFLVCLLWVSLQPLLGAWVTRKSGWMISNPVTMDGGTPCLWVGKGRARGGSLCLWDLVGLLGD